MFAKFRGLGRFYLTYRTQWILGFLCALTTVLLSSLGPPVIIRNVIDELQAGRATTGSVLWAAVLIMLFSLVANGISYFQRQFNVVSSFKVMYDVRKAVFDHLTTLDQTFYHRNKTGDLMNRLTSDLNMVREMLGFGVNNGSATLMRLVINVALMIVLSPTLGLIVLAVFPVLAGLLAIMVRAIAKRYEDAQEQFSVITARSQENFSGIRVVKGYAIEDREIEEYKKLNNDYKRKSLLLAAAEAPEWAAVGISMNTVFVIVLLMGSRELLFNGALEGKTNAAFAGLTLGAFVQFFVYLFELSWPILAIGWMTNIFQRGASSWARLQEILDDEPEIQDTAKTDHTISSVRGEIRFDHVSLKAGGRTLLNDVNLLIPVGQTIGITGRTGSGKTLMAQLVGRLLEPTGGSLQIDGRDSREIPLEVLRKNIGLVPQEPFLFSAEIKENISFGLPESTQIEHANNVDLERIKWAANVAGLAKDVEDFPDQYDTVLGERGVTLSGGQRQRTALARAVARKPAILILDDSMSAVDTETEARILTELKTVLEGRTVMLIGHRVSTLRYADHIIVLEAGRILEQGSHEDLIKLGGHYAEMDRKQSLEKDVNEDDIEPQTQIDRLEV